MHYIASSHSTFALNYWALSSKQRDQLADLLECSWSDTPKMYIRWNLNQKTPTELGFLPGWFCNPKNQFSLSGELVEKGKYYRLYDWQTGRYMATGYNAESEEELAKAYKKYVSGDQDPEDKRMFAKASTSDILGFIRGNSFAIEESTIPFPDENEFDED